jgi:hypothetical protein
MADAIDREEKYAPTSWRHLAGVMAGSAPDAAFPHNLENLANVRFRPIADIPAAAVRAEVGVPPEAKSASTEWWLMNIPPDIEQVGAATGRWVDGSEPNCLGRCDDHQD